ncbi:hypothetical protein CO660_00220 [Rhizobium sp. L9]|nr:hypothetical protein CO660_00220 [Rhizobium sp. L9]
MWANCTLCQGVDSFFKSNNSDVCGITLPKPTRRNPGPHQAGLCPQSSADYWEVRMTYHGFYTLQEVMVMTSMSERTIGRLVEKKRFPPKERMSPGRVGFRKLEFHRWEAAPSAYRPPDQRDDNG